MNRAARIYILLVIDSLFFFVELIVGYAVGSLALVADSFHMLNDVMSLAVALYAIKLSSQTHIDSRYSYGWHRAEILAALVNGVFLLALCFSISLEAIERFFSVPEISQPRLVVLVGTLGLASNIVGLFLFHEHGHVAEIPIVPIATSSPPSIRSGQEVERVSRDSSPKRIRASRERSESYSSMYGHPAATRASMVQAAQEMAQARSPSPVTHMKKPRHSRSHSRHTTQIEEETPTSGSESPTPTATRTPADEEPPTDELMPLLPPDSRSESSSSHSSHEVNGHAHGGPGHSHGSMNMRALLLHVFGDALGNVGVIATGLVIWLTSWSWKYYFDPMISLVITAIIFSSALPLVRSTSFILLQGVPSTVSLDEVRAAILAVDGVLSLHELHIWQLSENKIVASVHVTASRSHDFMPVAAAIRKALHQHGIHSSTIQPEYHHPRHSPPEEHLKTSEETSCLIPCPPDQYCNPSENACCL
ncbi:unnamed protein product [Somion occarium]|uniref:Cation efflux protein n=1 Tax=Somion occarium TaxID=3059160 RepID=A0ABP1CL98_9APHY